VATAHALSIRAQIAVHPGVTSEAKALFEQAIRAFREQGMSLFAVAAQRSLGRLLGDEQGRALVCEADRWMIAQGIRDQARMAALYVAPVPEGNPPPTEALAGRGD
jgi:hypothetical protein